jgi:transcriptional regulator with XRE-family HTH domain
VPEYISQAFGRVVQRRREAKGISQEKLAEVAGIHRTYVSKIELGKVRLGLNIANKVAEAIGEPLSRLIEEAEKTCGFESIERSREFLTRCTSPHRQAV